MRVVTLLSVLVAGFAAIALGEIPAYGQTVSTPTVGANPVAPVANPCPRF